MLHWFTPNVFHRHDIGLVSENAKKGIHQHSRKVSFPPSGHFLNKEITKPEKMYYAGNKHRSLTNFDNKRSREI